MPFREYRDLLEVFIDPELACAAALARVANTQLDEVAGTLVNIFAINNRVNQFVRTLTTLEILQTRTPCLRPLRAFFPGARQPMAGRSCTDVLVGVLVGMSADMHRPRQHHIPRQLARDQGDRHVHEDGRSRLPRVCAGRPHHRRHE